MKTNERGFYEALYNQSLPTFHTLVKKTVHSYHPNPVTNSTATPIYELQFATEKGLLTFEIDAFGYQTIPKGTKSVLTYQGYELISFKGWYPVEQKSA